MFYRLLITLAILLFIFSFAFSQGFFVKGSYPSNGQAGVPVSPDSVLLWLAFSKPVKLDQTWPYKNIPLEPFNFLAFDPLDSIELGIPYFSLTFDTVSIYARLRPNTDYCVILWGAYSTDGELLNKPYVLNFTTSSSTGSRRVSGTVSPPSGEISLPYVNFSGVNLGNLKLKLPAEFGGQEVDLRNLNLLTEFHNEKLGLNILSKVNGSSSNYSNLDLSQPLKIASVDPNVGVVALLDGNPFTQKGVSVKYTANLNSDFSFTVNYVRDGSYYLFVPFDTQRDGIFDFSSDLLLFYDSNGDGQPDPINVSGNDIIGLNVSGVFQIRPFTVGEKLDTVKAFAQLYASDAVLREINAFEGVGDTDTLDGKVYFANYGFYSPSKGYFMVNVDVYGIRVDSVDSLTGSVNLPATFVDNDVAFDSAEANGGHDFRGTDTTVMIIYSLRNPRGNDLEPPDTTNPYWIVGYFKYGQGFEFIVFYLDPSDGHLVKKSEFVAFKPVTAKEKFNEVNAVALNYASDARLMYALGIEDSLVDGKCYFWNYGYRTGSDSKFSIWVIFGNVGQPDTTWLLGELQVTRVLDFANYKDSDTLSVVAERNGGAVFRGLHQLQGLVYAYVQSPLDTTKIYFHSVYDAFDTTTERYKQFIALVDPVTGMFVVGFTKVERDASAGVPTNFTLYQNYPNPFNPATTISYDLPVRTNVKLAVYNILGQEVAVLVNETQEPGRYNVKFEATDLPSGIYFYKIEAGKFVQMKKMVLIK